MTVYKPTHNGYAVVELEWTCKGSSGWFNFLLLYESALGSSLLSFLLTFPKAVTLGSLQEAPTPELAFFSIAEIEFMSVLLTERRVAVPQVAPVVAAEAFLAAVLLRVPVAVQLVGRLSRRFTQFARFFSDLQLKEAEEIKSLGNKDFDILVDLDSKTLKSAGLPSLSTVGYE